MATAVLTPTEAIAKAEDNFKRAKATGRGLKRAYQRLEAARAQATREARRADDEAKVQREIERDRITAAERKKQDAGTEIETRLRERETPLAMFVYGGKVVTIRLGHREMVHRGTARAAVQRLAYDLVNAFEDRVVKARAMLTAPPMDPKWIAPLLGSDLALRPADRLGLVKVTEEARASDLAKPIMAFEANLKRALNVKS